MVDARVKERLTGAIILVALLVLLVPELLSGPAPSTAAAAPASADGQRMRSYTIDLARDLGDAASSRSASAVVSPAPRPTVPESSLTAAPSSGPPSDASAGDAAGDGAQRASPPDGATSAVTVVEAPTPAVPARSPAVEPPSSVPPARAVSPPRESRVASAEREGRGGWAVQVGSFASRENAERLARELKGKGFESHVSESSGNGKRLWRVRVGPEPDRASAVALGTRLRASGQSGSVVPMP